MSKNQLKMGIVLSYITLVMQNAISIIYTPYMLRMLGQGEYGLYSLVSSIVGYLSILSFGFGSAYVRYYVRYKIEKTEDELRSLNGMFLTIYMVIAVVSLIIGSVLVINVENLFAQSLTGNEIEKAKILMIIMIVSISISFPISVFQSCISANEKFTFQRTVGLIKALLQPIILVPTLYLGGKSIAMALVQLMLTVVVAIADILYCLINLKVRFKFTKFEKNIFRDISVFSLFIFLNMIVDQINWSVDKFVLGMLQGTAVVAVYTVGAQFNTYFKYFSTYISSVYIPRANALVIEENSKQKINKLFIKVGRLQFHVLGFVLCGFILFGKTFITLWAGNEYKQSYYIALMILIPAIIPYIQNIGIEIQRAMNKHKVRSVLYFCIAITNLIVSIPLARSYGGIGAAIGTALSLIVGNGILMNIYYYKVIKIDVILFWKQILCIMRGMLVPCIIGLILNTITMVSWTTFLLKILVFSFSYIICIYMWGMNGEERKIVKGFIKKIKHIGCKSKKV